MLAQCTFVVNVIRKTITKIHALVTTYSIKVRESEKKEGTRIDVKASR